MLSCVCGVFKNVVKRGHHAELFPEGRQRVQLHSLYHITSGQGCSILFFQLIFQFVEKCYIFLDQEFLIPQLS